MNRTEQEEPKLKDIGVAPPPARIVVLHAPPFPALFPPFRPEDFVHHVKEFKRSDNILLVSTADFEGLGDHWISLAHLCGFARHFPDKRFFTEPVPDVTGIFGVSLPSNIAFGQPEAPYCRISPNFSYYRPLGQSDSDNETINPWDHRVLRSIHFF